MKNILIINLARFGDIIQTIPMIEGLNRQDPGCRIYMMVNSSFMDVCKIIPGLYKTVSLDFRLIHNHIFSNSSSIEKGYTFFKQVFDDLRAICFDKVINITPHDIGVISTFLSGDEKAFWSNINDWSKYYFNITKNWDTLTLNVVDLFKRIAGVSRQECFRTIDLDDESISYADNLLRNHGLANSCSLIGMQPGASTDDKKWPLDCFMELSAKIIKGLNAKIILFGGKDDICDAAEIEDKFKLNVINMVGRTEMSQLCALMSRTDILITNDTGPMHIAAFTGTKVISLNMGKEICETTGPYGKGNISLQPKIDCYPCSKPLLCSKKSCRRLIKPEALYKLINYLCDDINNNLTDISNEDFDIYISRFDRYGTIDFLPLFKVRLNLSTLYRKILRIVWDLSLSEEFNDLDLSTAAAELEHVFEKYFYTGNFDEIVTDTAKKKLVLQKIAVLSSNGLNIARQIYNYSRDVNNNIIDIGSLSEQLEVINENIFKAGEGLSELKIIVSMFNFEIDSLKGENISDLAEETTLIYSHLKSRLNLSIKIIDYYIDQRSKTYNNQKIA